MKIFHIQNACVDWDVFGLQDMDNLIMNFTFTCMHIENNDVSCSQ